MALHHMKKTLFFALLVLFFSAPICFSQENADEQEGEEIEIANDEESVDDTDEYYAEDDEESEV